MKSRKTFLFFLVFLLILTLGCSLLSLGEDEPAAVEEAAPVEAVEAEAETVEDPSPAADESAADVGAPDRSAANARTN